MNRFLAIILVMAGLSAGGCVVASKLGTPGRDEKSVKAEFDLKNHGSGKVLIIVRSDETDRQAQRLGYNIYMAVKAILTKRELVPEKDIIDYRYFVELKNSSRTQNMSAVEIGKILQADTVFELVIEDYEMKRLPGTNYYEASMTLGGILHDVEKGWALWPEDGFTKQVTVGFDVDNSGYEGSLKRLGKAGGHCVTRYLYDCRLVNFKIYDENTNSQW